MILSHSKSPVSKVSHKDTTLFSVLKEEDRCKSYTSRRINNSTSVPLTIGITNVNEDVKFLIQR